MAEVQAASGQERELEQVPVLEPVLEPVQVRVQVGGSRVTLQVSDEGIGIAPEYLPRIFGRFERAVSERHYGGLGLGLYITRTIVEAMGGHIGVESRPGEGSLFTVELPLQQTSATVLVPPPSLGEGRGEGP